MGLFSALTYLVMAVVVKSSGQLADLLRTQLKIPTTIVLKYLNITLNNQITRFVKLYLMYNR